MAKKDSTKLKPKTAESDSPDQPISYDFEKGKNPWDYQSWETMDAYRVFEVYLRLGPNRSIARAYYEIMPRRQKIEWQEYCKTKGISQQSRILPNKNGTKLNPNPSEPNLTKEFKSFINFRLPIWAKKFRWDERARLWDEHLTRIELEAYVDQRKKLSEKCVKIGEEIVKAGIESIRVLINSRKMPTYDQALKMIEVGVKTERQGLGLDEETVNKIASMNRGTVSLSNLTDQELDMLIYLQNKANGNESVKGHPFSKPPVIIDVDGSDGANGANGDEDDD